MRCPTEFLSACVLAGCMIGFQVIPASGGESLSATGATLEGPVFLGLNAPLLSAPLEDGSIDDDAPELPQDTATEGTTASSKPKHVPEADVAGANRDDAARAQASPKNDGQDAAAAETSEAPADDAAKTEPVEDATALPPLSEEMIALRDSVRRTLATYAREPFNTRDNTPTDIMDVCGAFGCDAELRRDGGSGPPLNGITCLCWNYPCAGRELLRNCDGRIVPRVGYGYQSRPGEFLAVLAMSRVPCEYPIRVGDDVRKIDDLVDYEKSSCRAGADQSFKLIGLTRYLPTDDSWKNDLGEPWSISRMIREELAAPADEDAHGGTDRLLALSYVVDCRAKRGEPVDGQFKRAANYVAKFQDYAMGLQNPDGSWHPQFFAYRGSGGTAVEQLNSTGHILRWLVLSLPEGQLQDPEIVRSVALVNNLLANQRYRNRNLPAGSEQEIDARMAAVQALKLYDHRVFEPRDAAAEDKTDGEGVAQKTTSPSR